MRPLLAALIDGVLVCIFGTVIWLLLGGTNWLQRVASDRKHAHAWFLLTFDDEAVDRMRAAYLEKPGKFAMELDAIAMSRAMRAQLKEAA